MSKIMDSGFKPFKIRERDIASRAGGLARSIGRATWTWVAGRRTGTLGTTWSGSSIPNAIDEGAFGFIRKGIPGFLVRVSEAMPGAVWQARPGALVVLVDLTHGCVNVTFAKLKSVRISEMVTVMLNVMVVDLSGRSAARSVTREG